VKITKSKLKQIIKEELESVVQEIEMTPELQQTTDHVMASEQIVRKHLDQMIDELVKETRYQLPHEREAYAGGGLTGHSEPNYDAIASEMAHELRVGLGME
jgi:hypothetical protein